MNNYLQFKVLKESSNYFELFENLPLSKLEKLQSCLSVFYWRVPCLLNALPQKLETKVFEWNQLSIWLLESNEFVDVDKCFVSFPMLQPAYFKIFVNCVSNNNLIIHQLLSLVNHCFLVRSVFYVCKCYSRYVTEIVSDFLLRTYIAIQEATSILADNRKACQKLLITTFYKFTVYSDKLRFALLLRSILLSLFQKTCPITFPCRLLLNFLFTFAFLDFFLNFFLALVTFLEVFSFLGLLLLYFNSFLIFALFFIIRFAARLIRKLYFACFDCGVLNLLVNVFISWIFFL